MHKEESGEELGKSLFLACRCGQFQKAQELILSFDQIDPLEKDVALEWKDKKGNNHLHATVSAQADDVSFEARLGLCVKLLEEGFVLTEKNMDDKTVLELAPEYIAKKLTDLAMKAQTSRRAGGFSLIADAPMKAMRSAVAVVLAVNRFKLSRNSEEMSAPRAKEASFPPDSSTPPLSISSPLDSSLPPLPSRRASAWVRRGSAPLLDAGSRAPSARRGSASESFRRTGAPKSVEAQRRGSVPLLDAGSKAPIIGASESFQRTGAPKSVEAPTSRASQSFRRAGASFSKSWTGASVETPRRGSAPLLHFPAPTPSRRLAPLLHVPAPTTFRRLSAPNAACWELPEAPIIGASESFRRAGASKSVEAQTSRASQSFRRAGASFSKSFPSLKSLSSPPTLKLRVI